MHNRWTVFSAEEWDQVLLLADNGLDECVEVIADQDKRKICGEHLKTIHDKGLQGGLLKKNHVSKHLHLKNLSPQGKL